MHLTRRQSVFLAVSTIVLFFLLGTALLKYSRPAPLKTAAHTPPAAGSTAPAGKSAAVPTAEPAGAQFILKDFHRSETKNGKKAWEVRADTGQYFPETSQAQLKRAKLWFYQKNGDVIELLAKQAMLAFDSGKLKNAHLSAGVTVTLNEEMHLETEEAYYDQDTQSVDAPGLVKVRSEMIEISGEEMHADIAKREVVLKRNVRSVIRPKQENDKQDAASE